MPDGVVLEAVGEVSYSVEKTSRPWELDVDSIVVSVGSSLGWLGVALRQHYPRAPWNSVRFAEVQADRPAVLDLSEGRPADARLRRAILVTPRDVPDDVGNITDTSLGLAATSAITAAVADGAKALAIPLLGTGALAQPVDRVAAAVVPAVVAAVETLSGARLERLVFLCQDAMTEVAIRREFGTIAREDTRELSGGVARDLVDPTIGIPLTDDQLGFAPYVSMLATVVAERTTPLPLSVGVFGEWGSGKSYFMAMLRDRIQVLAQSQDSRYCDEIVQIGFNAWHYADTNLWASLADEIFGQLAGADPSSQQRAESIRADLADRLEQRHQLEDATREARAVAAALQADVERAVAQRDSTAEDLLAALRNSSSFQGRVDRLWKRLGITDGIEQAKLFAAQMRGTLTEADALRRASAARYGRIAVTVAIGLLGVGALVAVAAPAIRDMVVAVIGIVSACTGGMGFTLVKRARDGLRTLREMTDDLRSEMSRTAVAAVHEEVAGTLTKLRAAEADQRVAQAQLDDVVAHVGELGRQLSELAPGRRLYTFLAERADNASYAGRLGLVSTIRKDFEQLIQLMADWQAHPEEWETRRPVDRIVLYIDDLDRCRPDQVVDVLQAVHLLLAFELFVVVVGVDPQWLLRSLRSSYSELLHDHVFDDRLDERHTAEDYLEKILNIPLVVPSMPSGSLERLLRAIDRGRDEGVAEDTPAVRAGRESRGVPDPVNGETTDTAAITVEPGSEIDVQQLPARSVLRPRSLTEPEITLLAALDVFVDTPRQAKRLINLYRMVRATRDLSEASRFLGVDGRPGEYQAVVILLGVLTAPAQLISSVLDARPAPDRGVGGGLAHRPSYQAWSSFVDDVEPRAEPGGWANRIVGPMPQTHLPSWVHLHRGLVAASTVADVLDLSDLHTWMPRIRRFSYALAAVRRAESRTWRVRADMTGDLDDQPRRPVPVGGG